MEIHKIFRDMAEGVLGGMETEYRIDKRCRLDAAYHTDAMLMVVVQNIERISRFQSF